LQAIFGSRPISLSDGIVIVAVGLAFLMVVELEKSIATRLESSRAGNRRGTTNDPDSNRLD
jgi:hypothetical protein